MKDTAHHLKHIQKKIVQASRKETRERWRNTRVRNDNVDYLALPANSKSVAKNF